MSSPGVPVWPDEVAAIARLLIPALREAVVVTDAEGRVTYWNEGATRVFGWSAEERVGRPLVERLPECARADVAAQMRAVLEGVEWYGECEDYRKDGSRVWLDASVRPLRLDSGAVVGILGIAEDITARKEAEAVQRDNAERLRLALEAAHAGVWDWDLAAGRVTWSPENYRLHGVESGCEVTYDTWASCVHPDDLTRATRTITDVLDGRSPDFRMEFRVVVPGRGVRWLLGIGNVQRGEDGQSLRMFGINIDITERTQSEQALRDSESRLADAQSAARLGSWTWDPQTGEVWWSPVVYELLGLDRSSVPSVELFVSMVHPDDLPVMDARREAVRAGASEIADDIRIVRPDGSLLWLDSRARCVRDDAGVLIRIEGTHQDVTERRRSEIDRNAAQAERDYLWNNSPDPVCTAGFDGYLHQLNPAWTQRLGWSEKELQSRPWLDFVHPDDRESTIAAGERLRRGETVYGFVNRYRTRDGSYRWFSWNAIPFPDRESISAFIRDVTEEQQLSEQIRQSQKMEAIGRLAGGVAHDFNNLLTVINGYTALLLEDVGVAAQRESLEAVREAGERAAALTAQLLAFSRKAIVEPKVIDINRATESALRLLRRLVGEDIELVTDFASALPPIRIDPDQLEQVVMNLVVNGRDAMPRGGVLRVSTGELRVPAAADSDVAAGHYVRLTVCDNGAGMTDEVKSRIFEPFYTTKAVGEGTGLGLATVYGIVRQAGGTISVDTAVGRGSTFHVLLPATDGDVDSLASAGRVVPASPEGRETILLVEDEGAVRRFARLTLEKQGYVVIEASSAREAIMLPSEVLAGIALLITDVIMPVTGGRELAGWLRRRYPGMRVLYISGYTDDAVVRHGLETSTDAFLQKPFQPQALTRKVRELLD